MKKSIRFLLVLLFLSISMYTLTFKPIKKAVQLNELQGTEYIIVKVFYSTASTWGIIGDNHSFYEMPVDVTLVGNYPSVIYDVQIGGNTFVCYGNYSEDIVTTAGYKNKVFEVDSWEVLYPMNHNSIFSSILSNKYLYSFEVEG